MGRRVVGPVEAPERDISKMAMRQSVPARKWVAEGDQRREEGVK